MPLLQGVKQKTSLGECRGCSTYCDRLIEPRGCLAQRCPYLYSYVDERSSARYMGCMRKVFKGEIDVDAFESLERFGGYGGIKMTGTPLSRCQYRIEPAHEGEGPAYSCVNPGFFDCEDPAAFDLRDALPQAG